MLKTQGKVIDASGLSDRYILVTINMDIAGSAHNVTKEFIILLNE